MQRLACFILIALTGVSWAYCQSADPRDLLRQKLNAQFVMTTVTNDRSDIRTSGSILLLQHGGLMMYSTACPLPPLNTYKNGKISQGMSGFGRDIIGTIATPGNSTVADYPHRSFSVGEKLWVTALSVQKDGMVFRLYSDPYDGIRYYGELKMPFEKGSIPAPDQALARIAEVLVVQSVDSTNDAQPSPEPGQGAQAAGQDSQPAPLSGVYFMQQTGSHLELNSDGSFTMRAADGRLSPGHFSVNGDTLVLTYAATGRSSAFTIRGDNLYANTGAFWTRQGDAPVQKATTYAPPQPRPPPPEFPSTYVSTKTPADQLQLNADHSFVLKEAGQTYRGTFAVSGNNVEINIPDTNTKTAMTIQGSNLVDPGGQAWTRREQSVSTPASPGAVRNDDIIKLVKAGIDDATIIAKIESSKCEFDTSPDALIQMKQSHVSAAVLKAVVAAGK